MIIVKRMCYTWEWTVRMLLLSYTFGCTSSSRISCQCATSQLNLFNQYKFTLHDRMSSDMISQVNIIRNEQWNFRHGSISWIYKYINELHRTNSVVFHRVMSTTNNTMVILFVIHVSVDHCSIFEQNLFNKNKNQHWWQIKQFFYWYRRLLE
jgi:hypothetical protein